MLEEKSLDAYGEYLAVQRNNKILCCFDFNTFQVAGEAADVLINLNILNHFFLVTFYWKTLGNFLKEDVHVNGYPWEYKCDMNIVSDLALKKIEISGKREYFRDDGNMQIRK